MAPLNPIPQAQNKGTVVSALVVLNLASFSFGQAAEPTSRPEPTAAPVTDHKRDPDSSISAPLPRKEETNTVPENTKLSDLEELEVPQKKGVPDERVEKPSLDIPSMFEPFSRDRFEQQVLRAREKTSAGGEMFHYRFTLKPVEGAPQLTHCGVPVVAGWAHHDSDIKEIERHLLKAGFTVIDSPLAQVLPNPTEEKKDNAHSGVPTWVKTIAIPIITFGVLLLGHIGYLRLKVYLKNRATSKQGNESGADTPPGSTTEPGVDQDKIGGFKILPGLQKALSIDLLPGQRIVAESGAMMHYQPGIDMTSVAGRSIGYSPVGVGPISKLLAGESFFFQTFQNTSDKNLNVTLTASRVGTLLHLDLSEFPDGICADNGAFFAATPSAKLSIVKLAGLRGAISGVGIFQQRLTGSGQVFLHTPGELHELNLAEGTPIVVDTHCVFAWQPSVKINLRSIGIVEGLTSGEGIFVCELSGSGKVWLSTSGSSGSSNGTGGVFSVIGRALDRVF